MAEPSGSQRSETCFLDTHAFPLRPQPAQHGACGSTGPQNPTGRQSHRASHPSMPGVLRPRMNSVLQEAHACAASQTADVNRSAPGFNVEDMPLQCPDRRHAAKRDRFALCGQVSRRSGNLRESRGRTRFPGCGMQEVERCLRECVHLSPLLRSHSPSTSAAGQRAQRSLSRATRR